MEMRMRFVVSIYQDEDGMYVAECPSIPGCVSQGQTETEAETNIADAIRECLAHLGGEDPHCARAARSG